MSVGVRLCKEKWELESLENEMLVTAGKKMEPAHNISSFSNKQLLPKIISQTGRRKRGLAMSTMPHNTIIKAFGNWAAALCGLFKQVHEQQKNIHPWHILVRLRSTDAWIKIKY